LRAQRGNPSFLLAGPGANRRKQQKESSFCEQKEAKKLYSFWLMAKLGILIMSQTDKVFFASFCSQNEDSSLPCSIDFTRLPAPQVQRS
jgi:hypothetical protein